MLRRVALPGRLVRRGGSCASGRDRWLRKGVGGRPRRRPAPHGAEVTVRELERRSRAWLLFHQEAWQRLKQRDWKQLVRAWPRGGWEKLRALLREADEAVAAVAAACRQVRSTLAGLVRQAGRGDGRPAR